MSKKLDNAHGLYMEGIRDGKVREAITKYTGARYTQHSTGVADGIEGFVDFFETFIKRNPERDIQIIRSFEDGQFVFVHAYQNINNGEVEWVTADIFDTDENDKIIEHWDVIQVYEEETSSGRNMIDGQANIEDLEKTEENKKLVSEFCEKVLVGGQINAANNYISTKMYHQHSPLGEDNLEGFIKELSERLSSGKAVQYIKVHRIIGQGNFVAVYSRTQLTGEDYAVVDLYRVKDGKIVEHWDVKEKILAKEEWGNSGKF